MANQFLIAVLTIPALTLVGLREFTWRRWGFIVGMLGQPVWLYVTWSEQKYGMFIVSVFSTGTWAVGIWTHWIRPKPN